MSAVAGPSGGEDGGEDGGAPRPRLLIVDDEPINIQVLFHILRGDHDVSFATGGLQALELCARQAPDLILLDVQMPDLDGMEVCRRLKADASLREVPVIFVSGKDDAVEIARGLEAGAVDFISKPINRLVVRARVRVHLELRAQSERRRASDRLQQMVESAPNAMIVIDPSGLITLVNRQAEELFRYPREELIGGPIEPLVPEEIRRGHPALRDSYERNPIARPMGTGRELFGLTRDGRRVPIEIGLSSFRAPHGNGVGQFVLASIVDITERRQAQQALLELNETLQRQIAETEMAIQQLRQAQDQLVQSEKMASLGGLVAGVAHEINTPVGVGVTAASHLREEVRAMRAAVAGNTLSRNAFEQYLSGFEQASDILLMNLERAAELIRSFKQVAVDQSSEQRRRIRLRDYIDEVLLSLRPKLKATPHRVELECPADLELDTVPGALSQIITNLVSNALLHAFEPTKPGRIRIKVTRDAGRTLVEFSDDGRGIPAENLSRVFDPFFTTRRGHGGTGLGLHIVYNLVRQTLRGSIEVHSTSGTGTRFLIAL